MAAREAMNALQSSFVLSEYESGTYPTGGLRFEKIVRFATVDCSKAGWLRKSNGKWSITETGKQALVTYPDPGKFYREAVRLYKDWKDNRIIDDPSGTDPLPDGEEEDDAKIVGVTLEQAEEQAWEEVAQYLHGINPYEFQDLVGELIKAMGYHIAWIAPPGKDGGVDILALKDPFGTLAPRIKIQVKRQKKRLQ